VPGRRGLTPNRFTAAHEVPGSGVPARACGVRTQREEQYGTPLISTRVATVPVPRPTGG